MQGPAITIAKELGYYTIALDGSSAAPCTGMADRFEQIDLKDKEGIENFARSIQGETDRLGIMTAGTDFSANVAWTAEKLGLPGIPYEAALNASDKSRMRECFKKACLPSPDFIIISKEDIHTETQRHRGHKDNFNELILKLKLPPFPVVVKPVDNMGSRGCRRVDSIEEFAEAAKTAIGFSRSGRAIVESYMDGPEFSVDAIVYHGEITICGLADRHIFFPPYFIEMGHTMPTVIAKEKQQDLLDTFRSGIYALGLSGRDSIGAAKGDIKLTSKGPMIGEIAARLSGGYMSGWTYPYSSGALPIKGAILAAMGKNPEGLIPTKSWTCAERAFISIPGTVKEIVRSEELGVRSSESGVSSVECGVRSSELTNFVNDIFMRIKEGDKVSFPENNVTKCGNIIASAPDRESAVKAAEDAARMILIRLDPSDMETKKFITGEPHTETQRHRGIFPPDAFTLTNELQEALKQLPDPTPHSSLLTPHFSLTPFPAFENSGLTDYMGRTVKESLKAVSLLCASVPLCETLSDPPENAENVVRLGRSFWAALIRGGYQGAVYYIDSLGEKIDKEENR